MPKVDPAHVFPLLPHLPSVETLPGPWQVPKPGRQPAVQWSVVLPQKPLAEQQLPNPDPVQVLPLLPHVPSVVMLPAAAVQFPKLV